MQALRFLLFLTHTVMCWVRKAHMDHLHSQDTLPWGCLCPIPSWQCCSSSKLFPLWLSTCLFHNSLCFLVPVASPPRSFVSIRGRPCATQALRAHTWVWAVGGRRSECGKGRAEGSSPLSLFGSGVGWGGSCAPVGTPVI